MTQPNGSELIIQGLQILQALLSSLNDQIGSLNEEINQLKARIEELENNPPTEEPPEEEPPTEEPPAPTPTKGIWASKEEIMARPTTGAAWSRLLADANSNWGEANLSDNNSSHDVKTLAGAFVAIRLNDAAMREKVINGLKSAMKSKLARALELGRGLLSYVVAADIIGYHDKAFEDWVADMLTKPVQGHSGGSGLIGTTQNSATNWGGMTTASLIAGALYLPYNQNMTWQNKKITPTELVEIALKHQKEMYGLPVINPQFQYESDWHAGTPKAGVNVKGATKNGINLSGVLPEDWRRGGNFKWEPTKSGYMWEGIQGFLVTAVILHRAGLLAFDAGDKAVERVFNMLYRRGEAALNSGSFSYEAEGDDQWTVWVVNRYANTDFPTKEDTSPGKGMGYAQWLLG